MSAEELRIMPIFIFFPPRLISETNVIVNVIIAEGQKQPMYSTEIITTILITFWLRLETLVCELSAELLRHRVPLLKLRTNTVVQIVMMIKAAKGKKKLLIPKEIFSTCSRSSLETSPRRVLFLQGWNFISSLFTAYTGLPEHIIVKKTQAVAIDTRFGVTILFAWKYKRTDEKPF